MKLTPIRHIDTLAAYEDFKVVFGEAKGKSLATAIGKAQAEPETAPQVIADLQRAGFTHPQAEEVVRQTIIAATGETPPAELLARAAPPPSAAPA